MSQIIIIGAGISGLTLAERYASIGKKVLIIEKRNHIGGNCFDYINEIGVRISKYGAHIFHTDDESVWKYVQNFSSWIPYEHKVLSFVNGKLVPIPVNITTVNILFNLDLNEQNFPQWLEQEKEKIDKPRNSEEVSLQRVGKRLYEIMFKNYTKKQWDKYPQELDPLVMARIPLRDNNDDRYFTDKYQGLPESGYSQLFRKMIENPLIELELNTDYFRIETELSHYEKLFFTGPIDQFFKYQYLNVGKLEYRSLKFEFKTLNKKYYQSNSVVNYPNDYDFTRIIEYKHFYNQRLPKTTICKEYPTWEGEPYYPVPNPKNIEIYTHYQKEAKKLEEKKHIYMVGRLANYKYYNMDQAFKNALQLFRQVENNKETTQ